MGLPAEDALGIDERRRTQADVGSWPVSMRKTQGAQHARHPLPIADVCRRPHHVPAQPRLRGQFAQRIGQPFDRDRPGSAESHDSPALRQCRDDGVLIAGRLQDDGWQAQAAPLP